MFEEKISLVEKRCPMCDSVVYMKLSKKENKEYLDYYMHGGLIQERMPSLSPFGREFLKSGYCPECQSHLFGTHIEDYEKDEEEIDSDFYGDQFVYYRDIRKDAIQEFHQKCLKVNMGIEDAVCSEYVNSLTLDEKYLVLCWNDLLNEFEILKDGTVQRKEKESKKK